MALIAFLGIVALVAGLAGGVVLARVGLGSGPADPTDALVDATTRSFGGPVGFELTIEAVGPARAELALEEPEMMAFVQSFQVRGNTHGGGLAFTVAALGFDVLEVRSPGDGSVFARLDPVALAALSDNMLSGDNLRLAAAFLPGRLGRAADTAFSGGWVGFEAGSTPSGISLTSATGPSRSSTWTSCG